MTEQHDAPQDPEHDAAGSPARPPADEPVGGQEQAERAGAEHVGSGRAHAEPAASESAGDQAGGSEADGPAADGSDAAEAVPADAVRDKTIGQVLSHLDGDFPGLTASKVRFLEDRGLLHPERTATGYRKYSLQDIERLRYILCLQRDHYLPLKVIRDRVEALERRGELPTAQLLARELEAAEQGGSAAHGGPGASGLPGIPGVPGAPGTGGLSGASGAASSDSAEAGEAEAPTYTMRELARRASVSLPMLRELIGYGLITEDEQGHFDAYALEVVRLCARLTAHGLGPRHLRLFRAAADREVGLVQQAVAPLASRRDEQSRERAASTARELSDICTRLHHTLVAAQVDRTW